MFLGGDVWDCLDFSRWGGDFFSGGSWGCFVDVVLFLGVLDLSRSGDFLMETELGFVEVELFEVEV